MRSRGRRRIKTRSVVRTLVIVVALAACAREDGAGALATQTVSGGHGAAIGQTASPLFETITVKNASHGSLVIETAAGAFCSAKAHMPSGGTVLAADFLMDRKVDANGRATWTYATPVAGAGDGSGRYEIACTLGGQTVRTNADFSVP
jgi:hypothetical protein